MPRRIPTSSQARSGFAWLELLLGLAAIALVFQFFPSLWIRLVWAVDLRNWSQLTFFLMNVVVVLALVSVRFGPDWRQSMAKSKKERRHQGVRKKVGKEKTKTKKELQKERETIQRIIDGRSRRIY